MSVHNLRLPPTYSKKKSRMNLPHTKDLCIELLKQLNCEVTTSKENENRLYFEYQGEHIVIDASNDSYFIEMWDPWWLIVPLDDLEQMSNVRKAINVTNSRAEQPYITPSKKNRNLFSIPNANVYCQKNCPT